MPSTPEDITHFEIKIPRQITNGLPGLSSLFGGAAVFFEDRALLGTDYRADALRVIQRQVDDQIAALTPVNVGDPVRSISNNRLYGNVIFIDEVTQVATVRKTHSAPGAAGPGIDGAHLLFNRAVSDLKVGA